MARPKRVFTDEEVQRIEEYARDGCKAETIARGLDIAVNTLKRHFGRKMRKLRALGKLELRSFLYKQAKTSPQTAIFIAKNELGMVDKQEIKTITEVYKPTPAEEEAAQAAAKVYKLKLAE